MSRSGKRKDSSQISCSLSTGWSSGVLPSDCNSSPDFHSFHVLSSDTCQLSDARVNPCSKSIKARPSWCHLSFAGEFVITGVWSCLFLFYEVCLNRPFSMDQSQQHMYGYGYTGFGTGGYKPGVSAHDLRPYNPPERRDPYEQKPMISSLAHSHHGSHTGRYPLGGGVPSSQAGLVVSPLQMPSFNTSPETLDKSCAYPGGTSSQGVPNGYGPAGWAFPERFHRTNQESGVSDFMQVRSDPVAHLRLRYPASISPYGSNADWRPNISPTEQLSVSFNDALNFPYPESPTTCANCRNHNRMDGFPGHHHEQRGVDSYTDFRVQRTMDYFLRPTNEGFLSNRQLVTQDTGRVVPHNDHLDVPCLEQPKLRHHIRKPSAADAPDTPLIVSADEDGASNGLRRKHKRKPRVLKPRKPRTLTSEGKAHAKAVRHCPGGACADCRRKKTKARDPPVTNLVFNTLIDVPSALTNYQRIYPWNLLISGLQTLPGLSPQHRTMALGISTPCSIDHLKRTT